LTNRSVARWAQRADCLLKILLVVRKVAGDLQKLAAHLPTHTSRYREAKSQHRERGWDTAQVSSFQKTDQRCEQKTKNQGQSQGDEYDASKIQHRDRQGDGDED